MAKIVWLFDGFKEGILRGFVHGVGGGDNEKAVSGFVMLSVGGKFSDLFNGDDVSFFAGVGFEKESPGKFGTLLRRDDEDRAASALGDCWEVGEFFKKH